MNTIHCISKASVANHGQTVGHLCYWWWSFKDSSLCYLPNMISDQNVTGLLHFEHFNWHRLCGTARGSMVRGSQSSWARMCLTLPVSFTLRPLHTCRCLIKKVGASWVSLIEIPAHRELMIRRHGNSNAVPPKAAPWHPAPCWLTAGTLFPRLAALGSSKGRNAPSLDWYHDSQGGNKPTLFCWRLRFQPEITVNELIQSLC